MRVVRTRRAIAVSPDPAIGQQLGAALEAAGAEVELCTALEDIAQGAALWVVHVADHRADRLARAHDRCPILVVAPRAELPAVVELMQASERVVGVLSAEDLDPARLTAVAARVLADDPLGLAKVMAPGTQVHSRVVHDYKDKSACLGAVIRFAEQIKAPRRCRDALEQCVDEMLMNALYDAPVGADGKPLFADIPARERARLRSSQSVAVAYASDGVRLAVSVRDAFGGLPRATVLRFLHKSIHAQQPVDRRAGGAGLGLYLMLNAATAVYFHVLPGIATEVICAFDLEASAPRLEELGHLVQADTAGRRPTPPARVLRARRSRAPAIVVALAVVVGAGAVLWPTLFPTPAPATVELDSTPPGAAVAVDGRPHGSTPVTLTTLEPGATVSVAFERAGYRAATARLAVPEAGGQLRLVQPLQPAGDMVRIRFVSTPPGARIQRTGQPASIDRTYTPADVFVEADRPHSFTLTMPKHVPLVIEPFTPARGVRVLERGGELAEGAKIHFEATLRGAIGVAGQPHCQALALPADCVLAPGTYTVEYSGADQAKVSHSLVVEAKDAVDRFELGYVEPAPGKLLQPGGAHRVVLEAGPRTVTVSDAGGSHRKTVTVVPGATVVAE